MYPSATRCAARGMVAPRLLELCIELYLEDRGAIIRYARASFMSSVMIQSCGAVVPGPPSGERLPDASSRVGSP